MVKFYLICKFRENNHQYLFFILYFPQPYLTTTYCTIYCGVPQRKQLETRYIGPVADPFHGDPYGFPPSPVPEGNNDRQKEPNGFHASCPPPPPPPRSHTECLDPLLWPDNLGYAILHFHFSKTRKLRTVSTSFMDGGFETVFVCRKKEQMIRKHLTMFHSIIFSNCNLNANIYVPKRCISNKFYVICHLVAPNNYTLFINKILLLALKKLPKRASIAQSVEHSLTEKVVSSSESHQCLVTGRSIWKRMTPLATKRSTGVTQEVNLREHVACTPLLSANKAAHSGSKPRSL